MTDVQFTADLRQKREIAEMFEEVKSIMMETLSIPEDRITPEANLEADLGISSLELYELGGRLMEAFDIEIAEDEIHTFITVNDIVEYITAHTK